MTAKPVVEPQRVSVSSDTLTVELVDGRTVMVPLQWFPRLLHGSSVERANASLTREGIHWPDLDEDISVMGLLEGRRSGESAKSLAKWLEQRNKN